MPHPVLSDLLLVLTAYFPRDLSVHRVLHGLGSLLTLRPLFRLAQNQRRLPYQRPITGWESELTELVRAAFHPEEYSVTDWEGTPPTDTNVAVFCEELSNILDILDWPDTELPTKFHIAPPYLLITSRTNCMFCPGDVPLRKAKHSWALMVPVLGPDMQWHQGRAIAASCGQCSAIYHVDHVTYTPPAINSTRVQRLEYDTPYLRISKTENIWVHRNVAHVQERATYHLKSSWHGFTEFFNHAFLRDSPPLLVEQSQKLFVEHMARRLVVAHGLEDTFTCLPDCSTSKLVEAVLLHVGNNQGIVAGALEHACKDCTHKKRYHTNQQVDVSVQDTPAHAVAEVDTVGQHVPLAPPMPNAPQPLLPDDLPDEQPMPVIAPPDGRQQQPPPPGGAQNYVRMAVMDGKTLWHRICAVKQCRAPLVNYKNGRFCQTHLDLGFDQICGIDSCQNPTDGDTVTCGLPEHLAFHRAWKGRYGRTNFHGVHRAIKKRGDPWHTHSGDHEDDSSNTAHTFRARHIYCVETVQWACGMPIGWAKCYDSESLPQVLSMLNRVFSPQSTRPQFIAYDNACRLLAHIVTQDDSHSWLHTTRFIVDAWHYINHRATDILCRTWCNPAPLNGSQPDLVILEQDDYGTVHSTRAFNTETAEQFNSWMDGFEAQLRQMTDFNFDFVVHSILLLYKEGLEEEMRRKGKLLETDEEADIEIDS